MIDTVKKLEKHPFNVMRAMTPEERREVYLDIKTHGFDKNFPIILYQNMVLDGWHRQEICLELGVTPHYEINIGDDLGAIDLVWRAEKRRNTTSSQWAVAAMKAQPIMEKILAKIKVEKAEKLQGNQNAQKKQMGESIPPSDLPKKERDESRRTKVRYAKMCHTNPKYIEKAKTLSPEVLEQIESGEISIGDIMRAERTEALKAMEKVKVRESMVANETSEQEVEITQEPVKVELSDEQILKLVRVARSKVKKLECTLVQREVKMEMESIFINVAPMEKIKEIQLTLGINLTE
jgi:hypothetical protein